MDVCWTAQRDAHQRGIAVRGRKVPTYLRTTGAAALAACLRLLTPSLAKIAAT